MFYWIWFSQIKGLGPKQKKILLELYKLPEKIYKLTSEELSNIKGIRKEVINNWEASKNEKLIRKYEKYIQENNIKLININDENYPKLLKEIYDPPITLFAKGNIKLLQKDCFSIVGCRDATSYGIEQAKKMSYNLSKNNIVIVSGLAKGIDNAAHIGTLMQNGETIAVLGCGVDIIYPKENIETYKKIIQKGLVISEYIVGTTPEPQNFIARNRIVSGLAKGILITEAKLKSGTMITTDFALEQGREVYVMPGRVDSAQSEGTNELIKQGAKVVTNSDDILEDLFKSK